MHHLKDENGTLITDRVEIANMLGAAIDKSSSSEITPKSSNLSRHNKKGTRSTLKTNRNLRYKSKFTLRDLKRSSKSPIIHSNFTPSSY